MSFLNSYQRARILLLAGAIIGFCIFWWGGRMLDIPVHPGHQASLLQQPFPLVTFLAVAVMLALCVVIGSAVAGAIRFNAGLLVGAIGLAALSCRGGTIRETIFWGLEHGSPSALFLKLALEVILLGVMLGLAWWGVREAHGAGWLADREGDPLSEANTPLDVNELGALGMQTLITAIGILILAQDEAKGQVLVAVFVASFAGAAGAHARFKTGTRGWHWVPPLLVGLIAYLQAAYRPGTEITIGHLNGLFAALARPLPLDYASAGTAGAIIGHWLARRWQREREAAAETPATA